MVVDKQVREFTIGNSKRTGKGESGSSNFVFYCKKRRLWRIIARVRIEIINPTVTAWLERSNISSGFVELASKFALGIASGIIFILKGAINKIED